MVVEYTAPAAARPRTFPPPAISVAHLLRVRSSWPGGNMSAYLSFPIVGWSRPMMESGYSMNPTCHVGPGYRRTWAGNASGNANGRSVRRIPIEWIGIRSASLALAHVLIGKSEPSGRGFMAHKQLVLLAVAAVM